MKNAEMIEIAILIIFILSSKYYYQQKGFEKLEKMLNELKKELEEK